jgi:hypothetical protein
MNSGRENSIMTNPISEMLDNKSLGLDKDFSTNDSSKTNWLTVILGVIIVGFVVYMVYKHYTGGKNIYEKIYLKLKDLVESIKIWFQSIITKTTGTNNTNMSNIDDHMREDHNVQIKDENPATVSSIPSAPVQQQRQASPQETNKDHLTQALNQATPNYTPEPGYGADDSYSSIQKSKSSSKSGWCYIGEDRGFRACINVGENDTCMSGDIFPTSDICVNPNLRM